VKCSKIYKHMAVEICGVDLDEERDETNIKNISQSFLL
jgi:hypothetical protein